jgi:hypothetical protein
MKRFGSAAWNGGLHEGKGSVSTESKPPTTASRQQRPFHNRPTCELRITSVLLPKADISEHEHHVCFVPKAEVHITRDSIFRRQWKLMH